MRIQRLTLDEWGDALPTSGFEWAHRPDVLRVIDDHATGELQLYGGFKGEQPVGLFPRHRSHRAVCNRRALSAARSRRSTDGTDTAADESQTEQTGEGEPGVHGRLVNLARRAYELIAY